ncbi:MAG: MOFRL family protein [Vicinamibacterales bacterium]
MIDDAIVGEARLAGAALARQCFERARRMTRPACVIASGETTVRVTGRGRGGRNQELAAAAATVLAESSEIAAFASAGTDGIDGPTPAAGALVDHTTLARAAADGLPSVDAVLANNNSYAFFDALGDLICTGPTGTNVGDLQVFLLA